MKKENLEIIADILAVSLYILTVAGITAHQVNSSQNDDSNINNDTKIIKNCSFNNDDIYEYINSLNNCEKNKVKVLVK